MKKLLAVISTVLCFTLLIGCDPDARDAAITAIVAEANDIALQFAIKNSDQRTLIANYEYAAATAVRSLSGGEALTPDDFKTYVSKFFPQTETFAGLASVITGVYAKYFPKIQGDPKIALQVLEAIAHGVETSAGTIRGTDQTDTTEPISPTV